MKRYLMWMTLWTQKSNYQKPIWQCVSHFRWVDDVENFNIMTIALDPTGYISEVDLEYSQCFHDVHANLQFCSTRDKTTRQARGQTPCNIVQ